MGPQHRMLGVRKFRAARVRGLTALIISRAIVNRGQPREKVLHRVRQRIMRGIHICEKRIASERRNFLEMKYRGHRRLRIARYVGVPGLARDAPGILVCLDNDDFRMPLEDAEAAPDEGGVYRSICQKLCADRESGPDFEKRSPG